MNTEFEDKLDFHVGAVPLFTLEQLVAAGQEAIALVRAPGLTEDDHDDTPDDTVPGEDRERDIYERYATYNENQPRVPAGHPNGGQWTDGNEYLSPIGAPSRDFPYEDQPGTDHGMGDYDRRTGEQKLKEELQEQEEGEGGFNDAVWGIGGLPDARDAKRDVAALIGSHLEREFTPEEMHEIANLMGINPMSMHYTDNSRPDEMKPHARLSQEVAAFVVSQWAMSSGDTHPWSVLTQAAIKDEFGLDDATLDHLNPRSNFGPYVKANPIEHAWSQLPIGDNVQQRSLVARVLRAHVRAQYVETQKALAEADIDSLELVRGAALPRDSVFDIARTGDVLLQPASSFTLTYSTARDFSYGSANHRIDGRPTATVIRSRVPRSRILSFPKTGFGCLNEAEVVVLGGKMKARIMYWLGD